MDVNTLLEEVRTLREKVEKTSLHAVRLRRENDFLVRSLLRLQHQRRSNTRNHNDTNGNGVADADECSPNSGVGIVDSPGGAVTPLSRFSSATSSAACVCCCSDAQLSEGLPPLCDDTDAFFSEQNTALRARVRALEGRLQRERLLRWTEAEAHTAELEVLRGALKERQQQQQQPMTHGGTNDSTALASNALGECRGESQLDKGRAGGGAAATNTNTAVPALTDEKQQNGVGTLRLQRVASGLVWCEGGSNNYNNNNDNKDVVNNDNNGSRSSSSSSSNGYQASKWSHMPDILAVRQEVAAAIVVSSPSVASASGAVFSDLASRGGEDLRSVDRMECGETNPEAFLRLTASRMQKRRQRMYNAVQPLPLVESGDEGSHRIASAFPPTATAAVCVDARREWDVGTDSQSRIDLFSPPAAMRRGRCRRPFQRLSSDTMGALLNNSFGSSSRIMSIAPGEGEGKGARHIPFSPISVAVTTNPNQLGIEVDAKGSRNRTWYTHQVLRQALEKIICVHSVEADVACSTSNSISTVSHDAVQHESRVMQRKQHCPCGAAGSVSPCLSDESSSSESTLCTAADGDVDAHSDLVAGKVASGMYRSTPSAALQRAIYEEIYLRFRCFRNAALMARPGSPFPPHLPPFSEENDDSELCDAFADNSSSSPNEHRRDEVCVTMHSPVLFSQIRSFLRMDVEGFRASLAPDCVWREALSPGKSGNSLIYFGNFVMKSVKKNEFNILRHRFLRSYAPFCESNPDTMLPRFYALLTFTWLHPRSHKRYVLMQNVFSTRYYIHRIYDVKGSTVGRSASCQEEAPRTPFGALLLKDNDLPAQLIICGPLRRAQLLAQFRSDTTFLRTLNIVDYSCLIGVRSRVFSRKEGPSKTILLKEHRAGLWEQTSGSEAIGVGAERFPPTANSCIHGCDGGLLSLPIYTPGDDTTAREDVYYLGIIDVLQEYTPVKRFENFAKGLWNDRRQISVVPPKEFSQRLCKVLENITV